MNKKGLAQIPLMIGLLVMAVAVPVATKLVQQNQDSRNQAAGCGSSGTISQCGSKGGCATGYRCLPNGCSYDPACGGFVPTNTPKPPTSTPKPVATSTPVPCKNNGSIVSSASQCCSGYAAYLGSSLTCASKPTATPTTPACTGNDSCLLPGKPCCSGNFKVDFTCSSGERCISETYSCQGIAGSGVCRSTGCLSDEVDGGQGNCSAPGIRCCAPKPTLAPTKPPTDPPLCGASTQGKCGSEGGCSYGYRCTYNPGGMGVPASYTCSFNDSCLQKPPTTCSTRDVCGSAGGCSDGYRCTYSPGGMGVPASLYCKADKACLSIPTETPTSTPCKKLGESCANVGCCSNSGLTCSSSKICCKNNGSSVSSASQCCSGYAAYLGSSLTCASKPTATPTKVPTATPTQVKSCWCIQACYTGASCAMSTYMPSPYVKCPTTSFCNLLPTNTPKPTSTPTRGPNPPTSGPIPTTGGCSGSKPADKCTDPKTLYINAQCVNNRWGWDEQSCNSAGRTESCGGKNYCCPSTGGAWTTDMSKCPTTCTQCVGKPEAKSKGDADCSGVTNLNDFSIWRDEFITGALGVTAKNSWRADFDCNGKVSLNDFSIWRDNFIKSL